MKPRSPRPLRILLAGDDAGFTRLIDQLVAEEAGLTVDLASSDHLSKGLDELAGKSADVILLALSRPNRDGLQLLGQTYEQAPGIPIVVLMQRDDAKFAERALDGGAHDVLVKGQVDNRGLIRSLRYAVERKVLEQALSESEDRFRLLVEHAQDLIYRYRLVPTPGFDYISPAALSITGYTPEEFYADPRLPFRLVHPADHDQLLARQQSRARHLPWVQTFRLRKKDGMVIWAEEQITPILDTTGNPIAFEGVIRDISERKRVEEERERLREEWTSIIAHDLRQPLMVIEGYAGLLKYELGDDGTELTLWANSIQTSVSRLNRMIVDLLDASRIEAKRLETEREVVDLPALVRSVVGRLLATIPDHPVRVVVDEEVPAVVADPGRLEQVLSNLVSNAAKYGYPNTEIEVALVRRTGEVRVSVSNRGDGIPPEALPRLFQRFRRTRLVRDKRIEGIGLGLYISKGIVEAHGGKIWADSTPGETTTFHFTLPITSPS